MSRRARSLAVLGLVASTVGSGAARADFLTDNFPQTGSVTVSNGYVLPLPAYERGDVIVQLWGMAPTAAVVRALAGTGLAPWDSQGTAFALPPGYSYVVVAMITRSSSDLNDGEGYDDALLEIPLAGTNPFSLELSVYVPEVVAEEPLKVLVGTEAFGMPMRVARPEVSLGPGGDFHFDLRERRAPRPSSFAVGPGGPRSPRWRETAQGPRELRVHCDGCVALAPLYRGVVATADDIYPGGHQDAATSFVDVAFRAFDPARDAFEVRPEAGPTAARIAALGFVPLNFWVLTGDTAIAPTP